MDDVNFAIGILVDTKIMHKHLAAAAIMWYFKIDHIMFGPTYVKLIFYELPP